MATIAPGMLTRAPSPSTSALSSLSRSRSPSASSLASSSSSSSAGGGGGEASGDDELAHDALGTVDAWTRRAHKYGFDPAQLQPARCEWGNGSCGQEYWEVEPLVEHVHNIHAFPHDAPGAPPLPKRGAGSIAQSYICDWASCPRRGKPQGSKFALVAHLRSHTGEKPFVCPRAECDKSFTRTDALQKHMRVQHGDKIVAAARAPPRAGGAAGEDATPAAASRKGKGKGRAKRAGSDDSGFGAPDEAFLPSGPGGGDDDPDAEPLYSADELRAITQHSGYASSALVGYTIAKAKAAYVLREHEQLAHELEALSRRERALHAHNEALLRAVLRREIGAEEDPAGRAALETFLTGYAHAPRPYPDEWTAGK